MQNLDLNLELEYIFIPSKVPSKKTDDYFTWSWRLL